MTNPKRFAGTRTALLLLLSAPAHGALLQGSMGPACSGCRAALASAARVAAPTAQFGFKIQKSERLLIREAWERADSYRPGKPNWFTTQKKDLIELHQQLIPEIAALPTEPPPTNATSLLGSLLRVLTTGDLALTLCSKEAPVLTELRDWLVAELPMPEAVLGLPEEQGRVLSTIAAALDARTVLDLGTFTGYSSIAMALATADDAKVICCEPDARAAASARDWWMKAGVASKMSMNECKAETLLARMIDESKGERSVDMVFVDVGDRAAYAGMHEQLMQLVRVGGVIIYYDTLWCADNILQHEPYPSMRRFNQALAHDPRVIASLVPLSYGITVCVKTLELEGPALATALAAQAQGDNKPFLGLLETRRAQLEAKLAELPGGAPPAAPTAAPAAAAAAPAAAAAVAAAVEARRAELDAKLAALETPEPVPAAAEAPPAPAPAPVAPAPAPSPPPAPVVATPAPPPPAPPPPAPPPPPAAPPPSTWTPFGKKFGANSSPPPPKAPADASPAEPTKTKKWYF